MKPIQFRNRITGENFICDNIEYTEIIDDVEYLVVHRPNETRFFKMRKDILEKNSNHIKSIQPRN